MIKKILTQKNTNHTTKIWEKNYKEISVTSKFNNLYSKDTDVSVNRVIIMHAIMNEIQDLNTERRQIFETLRI